MSAGLLALFLFILLALGFADKNWLNTPDKIWSRSPGSNRGAGLPKAANQEAGDVSRASHRFRKRGAAAQIVRDSKGKA